MKLRSTVPLAVMTAALTVTVLGCSSGGGNPAASDTPQPSGSAALSGELLIQVGPTAGGAYTEMAEAFQEANPGVTITVTPTEQNSQTNALLQTQLQSGGGPDIAMVGAGSGGFPPSGYAFAEQGFFADLDGSDWITALPDNIQPVLQYDGKTFLYPNGLQVIALGFDAAKLSDLGIDTPRTFDELVDACSAIKQEDPNLIPIAFPAGNLGAAGLMVGTIATSLVYQDNPEWNDDKTAGDASFADTPEWRGTLEHVVALRDAGCFAPSAPADGNNEAAAQLANGQAVMLMSSSSVIASARTVNPDLVTTMIALPADSASDTQLSVYPGRSVGVNQGSSQGELAKEFIEFMNTPEMQKVYVDAAGGGEVPSADFYAGNLPAQWDEVADLVPDSVLMPIITWPTPTTMLEALAPGVQGLLTNQTSVDQLLTDMDSSWGR